MRRGSRRPQLRQHPSPLVRGAEGGLPRGLPSRGWAVRHWAGPHRACCMGETGWTRGTRGRNWPHRSGVGRLRPLRLQKRLPRLPAVPVGTLMRRTARMRSPKSRDSYGSSGAVGAPRPSCVSCRSSPHGRSSSCKCRGRQGRPRLKLQRSLRLRLPLRRPWSWASQGRACELGAVRRIQEGGRQPQPRPMRPNWLLSGRCRWPWGRWHHGRRGLCKRRRLD